MPVERAAALDQLIRILESARRRKPMYFDPITPDIVVSWLSGLRAGACLAGLDWSPEHRRPALERRGLELTAAWETEPLAGRGLGPEAIVDELLAIEIAMWRQVGSTGADPAPADPG